MSDVAVWARVEGSVAAYDSQRGLGEVEDAAGRRYPFHCIAIADGTREIEVGAEVWFRVVPGLLGRWEARAIEPR